LNSLQIDTDFDDDIMSHHVTRQPSVFRGVLADDPEEWMRYMSVWIASHRTMDEIAKINMAALFLDGSALEWFYSLQIGGDIDGGSITRFETFKDRFLDRFRKDHIDTSRLVQEIWEMRQLPGQSTEDFVESVRKKAIKVDLSRAETVLAIRAGLRGDIKAIIMQHPEVTTMEDIVKWGTVAERYPPASSEVSKELIEMVKRIDETMHRVNVRPLVHDQASNDDGHALVQAEPAPSQEFAQNQSTWRPSNNVWRQSNQSNWRSPNQNEWRSPGQNNWRSSNQTNGQNSNFQRGAPRYQSVGPQQYQQPRPNGNRPSSGFANNRPTQSNNGQVQNGYSSSGQQFPPCQGCGRTTHSRSMCPANGTDCWKCGKIGHWGRICRSAPGPTPSTQA
jgi:hypothetical protein